MLDKLSLSLALPSSSSYSEKTQLVNQASQLGLGIYCSDLPPNHDLFQLISTWSVLFPTIPSYGTAIISPFSYPNHVLKKQIKTILEINGDRIEIGLGVGDPKLISKIEGSAFNNFKQQIHEIVSDPKIKPLCSQISLAGAGTKLLKFAIQNNLGIIFNGIPSAEFIHTLNLDLEAKSRFSAYIMMDLNNYDNLSLPFLRVVARVVAGLPKSERIRLNISFDEIKSARVAITNGEWNSYNNWLSSEVLSKVAYFSDSSNQFEQFVTKISSYSLKQVIFSLPDKKSRELFLSREFFNTSSN